MAHIILSDMEELKKNINSDEIIWSSIKIQLKDIYGEAEYSNWLKLLIFNKIEKNIIIFFFHNEKVSNHT